MNLALKLKRENKFERIESGPLVGWGPKVEWDQTGSGPRCELFYFIY